MQPVSFRYCDNVMFTFDDIPENVHEQEYKNVLLDDKDLVYRLNQCGFCVSEHDDKSGQLFLFALYQFINKCNILYKISPDQDVDLFNTIMDKGLLRDFLEKVMKKFPF